MIEDGHIRSMRDLMLGFNTRLDREGVPELHTTPMKSMSRLQASLDRLTDIGAVRQQRFGSYHHYISTDQAKAIFQAVGQFGRSRDWRDWPLEIPIIYDPQVRLDWGNAIYLEKTRE